MGGSNESDQFSNAVFVTNVTDGYKGKWAQSTAYPVQITDEACAVAYSSSGPYIYCMGGYGDFSGSDYDTNYTAAAPLGADSVGSWVTQPKPPSDFGVGITFPSCFSGSSVYTGTEIFCVGGWNQNTGVTTDGTVYASVDTSTGALGGWNYSTADSPQGPASSVGQQRCAYYNTSNVGLPYVYCINGVQPNWDGITFNNVAESYGTYSEVQSNGALGGWNSTGDYLGAPVPGEESTVTCSGASTGQYGAGFAACTSYDGEFYCAGGQAGNNGNDGSTNAGCDANDQSTTQVAQSGFGGYNGVYYLPSMSWSGSSHNLPISLQRTACVVAITNSSTPTLFCIGGFVGTGQTKTTGGIYSAPISGATVGSWASNNNTAGLYYGYGSTGTTQNRQVDSEACVSYTITTTVPTSGGGGGGGDGGGGSVYGYARILLPNNTTVSASSVKPGDTLSSYNFITGKVSPSTVTYVTKTKVNDKYVINGNLSVDADEVILLNGTWQRAFMAKVGDTLFNPISNSSITIRSINITKENNATVYDFYMSPNNNFIANGYLIDVKLAAEAYPGVPVVRLANGTEVSVARLKSGENIFEYNGSKYASGYMVKSVSPYLADSEYVINGDMYAYSGQTVITANSTEPVQDVRTGQSIFDQSSGKMVLVSNITMMKGIFLAYNLSYARAN